MKNSLRFILFLVIPEAVLMLGECQVWRGEDTGAEIARHVHGHCAGAGLVLFVFSDYLHNRQHTSVPTLFSLPVSLLASPILKFVIWDQSGANTARPSIATNLKSYQGIKDAAKPTMATNQPNIYERSDKARATQHPPWSPTLTLASHQLCCYRDRQKRERRESETDGRRLL